MREPVLPMSSDSQHGSVSSGTRARAALSGLGAHLSAALSDSPAQLRRLTQLAAALSAGRYHVDSSMVSASIIEESLRFSRASV